MYERCERWQAWGSCFSSFSMREKGLSKPQLSWMTSTAHMKTSSHDSLVLHHWKDEKFWSRWEIKTKKNGRQLSKSSDDKPITLVPLRWSALLYGRSQLPPVAWCLYSFSPSIFSGFPLTVGCVFFFLSDYLKMK